MEGERERENGGDRDRETDRDTERDGKREGGRERERERWRWRRGRCEQRFRQLARCPVVLTASDLVPT